MDQITGINLESLPPYYQKVLQQLQQNLQASDTNEEKIKNFEKFLENYFLIPPLWCYFFKLLKLTRTSSKVIEYYSNQALSQFYSEELYPYLVLSSKPFTKTIKASDQMPQKLYFEYTKSKKIYDKICKSYENEEKWIKILASTFDDDFIKQNIETRIAEEFANKKLWKLYIRYLEDTKDVWILSVFCRYCNFFIEDLGMREKYLDKIEYYSVHKEPVSKWWIDVISFTYNHGTFEDMKEMIHKALSFISVDFSSLYEYLKNVVENILPKEMYQELRFEIHKTDIRVAKYEINEWSNYFPTAFLCEKVYVNMGKSKILPRFDREIFSFNRVLLNRKHVSDFAPTEIQSFDPTPQYFLLPKPLIRYIMNSPCNVRWKIYQTCKYFFGQQKLIPVYCVTINYAFEGTHNQICFNQRTAELIKNLWLSGIFSSIHAESTILLKSKIVVFEPLIIHLYSQTLPFTTFAGLMRRNSCKVLKLTETFFSHENGTLATLNEILEASPSVSDYSFRCQFLATANQELPQHVRQNKIGRFTFKFADGQLGIPTFIQFLKKNAAPLCKVKISFHETATQEYRNQIKAALNNCINEMPKFCGKKWITCKFIAS